MYKILRYLLVMIIAFATFKSRSQTFELKQDSGLCFEIGLYEQFDSFKGISIDNRCPSYISVIELERRKYFLGNVYLPDNLHTINNVIQIYISNCCVNLIYPNNLNKIQHLSGITNECLVSNISFEKVPKLDSLLALEFGTITDSLTKIPSILYSPNLEEVTIGYKGQNAEILEKIVKKLCKKKSIKHLTIYKVHSIKIKKNERLLLFLKKYQKKYMRSNKKLSIYFNSP